jgi:hypothetical protein
MSSIQSTLPQAHQSLFEAKTKSGELQRPLVPVQSLRPTQLISRVAVIWQGLTFAQIAEKMGPELNRTEVWVAAVSASRTAARAVNEESHGSI